MTTYLVTGCAGFIASRVAEMLLGAGHRIVGVDNFNDYYDAKLKGYRLSRLLGRRWGSVDDLSLLDLMRSGGVIENEKFSFVCMDIEDYAALKKLFGKYQFEGVYNLAGRAGVRASMVDPFVYLSTNTLGCLNVLECMKEFCVTRLVLASSSSVYAGALPPYSETMAANCPLSPYAASKKAAELFCYSYSALYELHISVVRYFTVYGPAGRPDMSVLRFIINIDRGEEIEVFGDGLQTRDFTYVDDIANGTILAGAATGYNIFNLGAGSEPLRVIDLIRRIEDGLGKSARIVWRPRHAADMAETKADNDAARHVLRWSPEVGTREGLRRTIEWYKRERVWAFRLSTSEVASMRRGPS